MEDVSIQLDLMCEDAQCMYNGGYSEFELINV